MLSRRMFVERLSLAGLTPEGIVDDLRRLTFVVTPAEVPRVVINDPVIVAAITGQADVIASGDKRDILPLGSFQGIPIITAREAVEWLEARGKT